MLESIRDTCDSKTWVPIICPKIHPACRPLQTVQASIALGHCVSVKSIMPPSPLSTEFSGSCTWPWLRAGNTFAFSWINMQLAISQTSTRGLSYVRRTANWHYIVEVIRRQKHAISTSMSKLAPHPHPIQAYQLLTIICSFLPSETKLIWACPFIDFRIVFEKLWHVNITNPIISRIFIHLITSVSVLLVRFCCFTSPFVPKLETKSVIPVLTTTDSEHCW